MTPRECFHAAMVHEKTGRILLDMGKHIGSIHKMQIPKLKAHLEDVEISDDLPILDRMAQTIVPNEELLRRFDIDFRWIVPHWVQVTEREDVNGYIDMWGVPYRGTEDGQHFSVDGAPLRQATLKDLDACDWPDPNDPGQFKGLGAVAKDLYENTDFVIGADAIKAGPLMTALQMRGYQQFFMDLVIDPEFADALLDRITDLLKTMWTNYMAEVGSYVQIAYTTDDLGTQTSLLMSPDLFRKHIKPCIKDLHSHIKNLAEIKLMFHTDGAVVPLMQDIIEMDADILNPVQTSTAGMGDTFALKENFGERISFHGGIDVQQLMPNATVAEVRWEIAKRMNDLGRDGGYILAPCHNFGHEIPPENIVALYESAREFEADPKTLETALATNESYFDRH